MKERAGSLSKKKLLDFQTLFSLSVPIPKKMSWRRFKWKRKEVGVFE